MSAFQIKWQFFFFWSQIKFSDWNQTNSDSNGQNIKHSQHPGHHRSLFGGDKRLSTTGKTQAEVCVIWCIVTRASTVAAVSRAMWGAVFAEEGDTAGTNMIKIASGQK